VVAIQIRGVSKVTRRRCRPRRKLVGNPCRNTSSMCWILRRRRSIVDCLPNGRLGRWRMNRSPSSSWNWSIPSQRTPRLFADSGRNSPQVLRMPATIVAT
jgi:hypothetical protein